MKYYWLVFLFVFFSCSDSEKEEELENAIEIEAKSGVVATDPNFGDILRTPIEQFENLQDCPFKANYVDVGEEAPLMMHYIDEGSANGKVVLLMHGNPAWSYLVRKLVPILIEKGYRVIAPDLIGFGKSDKPINRSAHTYDNHVKWTTTFIQKLDLKNITLHCQDWGGLISLRVALYEQERFDRIFASNTGSSRRIYRRRAFFFCLARYYFSKCRKF